MNGTSAPSSVDAAMESSDGPKRAPSPRRWLLIVGIVVVVLTVIYMAAGWYISGKIIDGFRVVPHVVEYDTDVLAVDSTSITIGVSDESTVDSDRDAVMGLRWDGGYGQVGPTQSTTGRTEVRPFTLLAGELPPVGDDVADFDSFAFPDDPSSLGLDYETVTFPGPLGDLEAWLYPGQGRTWIVAVHGRAASRTEFLRLLDATDTLNYPTLVVTYRNDPGAPATDDGLLLLGQREYADVSAAVDYALANGATDVIVAGPSMGGALTLGYALHEERPVIRGLILEAPAADIREIATLRSGEALPVGGPLGDSLMAAGRLFVSLRTGLDFDTVDYVDRADELDTPVLLFHGTDDSTVPVEIGQAFADARPDLVEMHVIDEAAHVRAWNEDPAAYRSTVAAFLRRIGRSD